MRFLRRWTTTPSAAPSSALEPETPKGDVATLFERFLHSPEGRRLKAEQDAEDLARRQGFVAELLAAHAAREAAGARFNPIVDSYAHEVVLCEEALLASRRRLVNVERDRMEAGNTADIRIARAEGELRATAPAAIDAFIREARDRVGDVPQIFTRNELPSAANGYGHVTGKPIGNLLAVEAISAALHQAIAAARELKFEALAAAELEARLDALRAEVDRVATEEAPKLVNRGTGAA